MAFTYVTVQATFETADDLPASGRVEFTPVDQMRNGLSIVSKMVGDDLDGAGALSIRIAATTDPGTTPPGVTYRVVERIVGQPVRIYYRAVPHDQGSTLQLADLPPVAAGTPGGFALRNATDYDNTTPPTDGQVMTWDGTTGKFHPEAAAAGGAVSSVNGLTGAVTITASGIGGQPIDSDLTAIAALAPADGALLGRQSGAWTARNPTQVKTDLALDQVNNTSDANKPISNATATALAGKAAVVHTHPDSGGGTAYAPVEMGAVSGVVTPDLSLGYGPHTYIATSDVAFAAPTGGVDGQPIEVRIRASGATRVLTVAGGSLSLPDGSWWIGLLRYINPDDAPDALWVLLHEVVAASDEFSASFTPTF